MMPATPDAIAAFMSAACVAPAAGGFVVSFSRSLPREQAISRRAAHSPVVLLIYPPFRGQLRYIGRLAVSEGALVLSTQPGTLVASSERAGCPPPAPSASPPTATRSKQNVTRSATLT